MKNVTYYNAGAGSGKTFKLITLLVDLIAEGKAKPQELILTTFTEKAAAEFREKAKARLYERGMFDEALQIDNAMIGTVHSVCKQMVDKYWYMLGLVPGMGVIDEESQQFYMSQSLGDLPTKEEYSILRDFANNFEVPIENNGRAYGIDENFWRKHLEQIIAYATNYQMEDFSRSEKESLKFIEQFVNSSVGDVTISDEELNAMLKEAYDYVRNSNRIKKKEKYYDDFAAIKDGRANKTIAWRNKAVETLEGKYGATCSAVGERLGLLWRSREVYNAQKDYIHTLFELAKRWQEKYAQFKREKNLIDYNDMEHYMYQLLQVKDARNNITQSYRYLFVDEFQDSSPIQIKLFTELSGLVEHSYWVGDYKQSIYGFRGTDIDMVKAVKEGIDKDHVHTLGTSYRSLPPIVDVNNHLFTKLFANQLQPEEVELDAHRDKNPLVNSLRYNITESKSGLDVHGVAKLLHEGVKPSDIAVLSRTNATLEKIAAELHELGIASCLGQKELSGTDTWVLVKSLLSIADNPEDTLARAQVSLLTDSHYGTREIVEERLMNDADNSFLSDVPLVGKLLAMRDTLRAQSVAAQVEQMVIELGLHQVVKQVEEDPTVGTDCLQGILASARKYEDHCLQLNMPASIMGYIQYFESQNPTGFGNPDGVQLLTYHGCKGLQWKYVFLTSLDYKIERSTTFVKRNIYGVMFERSTKPTPENPNPEVYLRITPWIYATKDKVPGDIDVKLHESDVYQKAVEKTREEECRLFYVGMTRPRDVMIVSVKRTKTGLDLTLLNELGYTEVNSVDPQGEEWDIFNTGDFFSCHAPSEAEMEQMEAARIPQRETMLALDDIDVPESKSRRYISPSGVKATSQIGEVKDFGQRIPLVSSSIDMAEIGNCIHHIFAGIEEKRASDIDLRDIIRIHKLESALTDADAIKTAWDNLVSHLTATYGPAVRTWHERPFRMEKDGQTIVGSIDLVWKTAEGDILIDYKTNPEGASVITNPQSDHFAGHYGGQLSTYREALEAAGETVLKTMLYYPVSGLLVELTK